MAHFRILSRARAVIFIGLLGVALLAGCAPATTAPAASYTSATASTPAATGAGAPSSTPTGATTVSGGTYAIAVIFNGNQVAALTTDDLLKLDQVTITAKGSTQTGPALLSVLQAAGIGGFSQVTAYGMTRGRIATVELALTREQVDDTVVLDINKQGKTKLCGVNIPEDNWVIDVDRLEVK